MDIARFFRDELGAHVTGSALDYRGEVLPRGIVLVDKDNPPRRDYVSILSPDQLEALVARPGNLQGTYLFITGDSAGRQALPPGLTGANVYVADLPMVALYNQLQRALERLGSTAPVRVGGTTRFSDFINDLVAMHITRRDEIASRLADYDYEPGCPFRILVFEFDDSRSTTEEDRTRLIWAIKRLFPSANSASYFERIVTLFQRSSRRGPIDLPDDQMARLRQICEESHCTCALTNATIRLDMLRTNYMTAVSVLALAKKLQRGSGERVFPVQRYLDYVYLDICYHYFQSQNHHDNYIYMLSPWVAWLIHYDNIHDTDLCHVFYAYLRNERNYAKTAEELHMHRNTVVYKIRKALDLLDLGVDLDDFAVRHRLITCFMMLEYCEKALGIPPTRFPGYGKSDPM